MPATNPRLAPSEGKGVTAMSGEPNDHHKQELQETWDRYLTNGDPSAMSALIEEYLPLVRAVAHRMNLTLPGSMDINDIIQFGFFGLHDAIQKYDPSRATRFETYAASRIRGAILDEIRTLDWLPRSIRTRVRKTALAIQELESELHRPPTVSELSDALGYSPEMVEAARLAYTQSHIAALDEQVAGTTTGLHETVADTLADEDRGPADTYTDEVTSQLIAEGIRSLPERERLIIAFSYYENLSLEEISVIIGVTESRVSQLRSKAIAQLHSIDPDTFRAANLIPDDEP